MLSGGFVSAAAVGCSVFAGESKMDFKSDFSLVCAGPQMPPDLSAAWVQGAWVIVDGGALGKHSTRAWVTSVMSDRNEVPQGIQLIKKQTPLHYQQQQ